MEVVLYCGIPPQRVWLEIQQNMPWYHTINVTWSQLPSERLHDKPGWGLTALVMTFQLPLGPSWCPASVVRSCLLFSLSVFCSLRAPSHQKHLRAYIALGSTGNSYWEFPHWESCHQISKEKRIIIFFIKIGFSVMTFRPLSRQAGKHMFSIKHMSSLYSHATSQKCSLVHGPS